MMYFHNISWIRFILFNCCLILHVSCAFIWAALLPYIYPSHSYIHNILQKLLLSHFSHFLYREIKKKKKKEEKSQYH